METVLAILILVGYSITDGLSDAFIFRWMVEESNSLWEKGGNLWPQLMKIGAFDIPYKLADMSTNWHRAQAARQILVIGGVAWLSSTWQIIPLGAGLFWLLQDGIVNVIGLDRPFFFVGSTAWIDRMFQKFKHPEVMMGAAKILLLSLGILSFIVKW